MRWGFIPAWAKERKGYSLINARAETIDEKPTFKQSFQRHRCLIPADGFYEWKKRQGRGAKQPYFFRRKDKGLFSFAGLWSVWRDPIKKTVATSCAIITTAPNGLVQKIHNRMPAILPPSGYDLWLDLQAEPDRLKKMLVPLASGILECYPASDLCNSVRNDSSACIKPVSLSNESLD